MTSIPNLDDVRKYFDKRVQDHGFSARGSDWNSTESQYLRFDQLIKVVEGREPFSILDYGSGSGALVDYLILSGYQAEYIGYDLLENAIELARKNHAGKDHYSFTADEKSLPVCDYVVASGIFNYRGEQGFDAWTNYMVEVLHRFNDLSCKGFSSNFLTKYSDEDKMREDLYYADPLFLFDYCKKNFSKNVALLHDYRLYDFTILVRKQ